MVPRRAMVLAAGFGSRMRPLTDDLPKALLPFLGKPLLQHTLEHLRDWGVREVLINTHYLPEAVLEYVLSEPVPALRLSLSHEPEILGTGGGLTKAGWFFSDDEPFWIVNADVVARLDPKPLLKAHAKQSPLATLWMHPERGPRTVRVVDGRVVDFAVANPGEPGTFTFTGLHLTDRRILEFLAPEPIFESVITAYRRAMAAGHLIGGVAIPDAYWADVGTPEQYLAAHAECGAPSWVAPSVDVAAGAVVERSVVFPGVSVGARAVIRDAVVGRGTRVAGPVSRVAGPAELVLQPEERAELLACGWEEKRLSEAAAVSLAPRGSDREFIRLMNHNGKRRVLLMRNGETRRENFGFASHARFLAGQGVAVPAILGEGKRFYLVEDLGEDDLLSAPTEARYRKVIKELGVLHGVKVPKGVKLQKPFTLSYLKWEHALFAEAFVCPWLGVSKAKSEALQEEIVPIAKRLARSPRVLLHRDLQSTNVLFRTNKSSHKSAGKAGQAVFIDFQGMRMGPAMYDVASLLADPYVDLDADVQARLLQEYDGDTSDFALACLQRLLQAVGAYGRLGAKRPTRRFLQHIPAALRQMERALDSLEMTVDLPILREMLQIAFSKEENGGYA